MTRKLAYILLSASLVLGSAFAQNASAPAAAKQEPAAPDILPDEDGGQVRILPIQQATTNRMENRAPAITTPHQQSIFFGSKWAETPVRGREAQLAGLMQNAKAEDHDAVRTKRLTPSSRPTTLQEDFTDIASVTDLQMQGRLAQWIRTGVLAQPDKNTVYVVYLGPGVQSTLRGKVGGRDFLAYYNLVHLDGHEVRYVVVPYEADAAKLRVNATRMFAEAAIDPAAATR